MHFHLPKPIHGWRAFIGEVGIIVLGVLIALAFEAIVDRISWNFRVSEARQELRYEMGFDIALIDDRIRQRPCAERRLDELGLILNEAGKTGKLPPLGTIDQPSHYTWPEAVWETQMSAQTASHLPARELASIARIYRLIDVVHQLDDADRSAWVGLSTMAGPGRPVDPGTIDRLVQALAQARRSDAFFVVDKGLIDTILSRSLGKEFPQIDSANPPIFVKDKPLCHPIVRAVPAIYGTL